MALTKAHNRMITGAPVNVLDFGAVGDGVTDDTAAIQAALDSFTNGGSVFVPSGTYLCNLVFPDDIELFGEGYTTHLKTFTTPLVPRNGRGRPIDCGNYTSAGMALETYYNMADTAIGDKTFTLDTISQDTNFTVGDIVFLKTTEDVGTNIPAEYELNEVTSIASGVIGVKYPIQNIIAGAQALVCVTGAAGTLDPLGRARRIVKRPVVRDMRITAIQDWWHAAGGTWEGVFNNLFINADSYASLNFNAWCTYTNITSSFDRACFEIAIGVHNSRFIDVDSYYEDIGSTDRDTRPIIGLGEGCFRNEVKLKQVLAGAHNTTQGAISFVTSKENIVHGGVVEVPSAGSGAGAISFLASVGTCSDNICDGVETHFSSSTHILCDHGATATAERNKASNNKCFGTVSTGNAIQLIDGNGIDVHRNWFENGEIKTASTYVDGRVTNNIFDGDTVQNLGKLLSTSTIVKDNNHISTQKLAFLTGFLTSQTITSTSANNVIKTITGTTEALQQGDILEYEFAGNIIGTNDTKRVRILLNGTAFADVTAASGTTGAIDIRGEIYTHLASSTKRGMTREVHGSTDAISRVSANINTNTSAAEITVEVWVTNGSDSVGIDYFTIKPRRINELQ